MTNISEPQRTGFLRLKQIISPRGLIPVSRSTWYARVATGEFPAPVKIGRMSLWAVEDIDALVARLKDDAERHSARRGSSRSVSAVERA
jgi:prophage regulatory protein